MSVWSKKTNNSCAVLSIPTSLGGLGLVTMLSSTPYLKRHYNTRTNVLVRTKTQWRFQYWQKKYIDQNLVAAETQIQDTVQTDLNSLLTNDQLFGLEPDKHTKIIPAYHKTPAASEYTDLGLKRYAQGPSGVSEAYKPSKSKLVGRYRKYMNLWNTYVMYVRTSKTKVSVVSEFTRVAPGFKDDVMLFEKLGLTRTQAIDTLFGKWPNLVTVNIRDILQQPIVNRSCDIFMTRPRQRNTQFHFQYTLQVMQNTLATDMLHNIHWFRTLNGV
jgi:hypothetical protein